MRESQPPRMQKKPPDPALCEGPVELEIAVFVVPQHRMAGVGEMDPDLMRAAGEELYFQDARLAACVEDLDPRQCRHALLRDAYAPLAAGRDMLVQGFSDLEGLARRPTFDYSGVDLIHLSVAQLAVHLDQRAALLADDEQPGS